jgi:hypothetical protein
MLEWRDTTMSVHLLYRRSITRRIEQVDSAP